MHPHHSHVLQLDIQGTPQAWISLEHAALHVATGSVAWVDGDGPLATLRGGFNVQRGRQSIIDVHPIIALHGASRAALVRPGNQVEARSPGVPGSVFRGTVHALLPEVNATTRTLKARMQFANPDGRLVPGLFVTMQFMDTRAGKALLVPTEAVIQTGRRAVVMVAEEGGRFAPVEVETGLETGGQTEIRRGLKAGQRVVVSSQFLIDSEASLKGVEARLDNPPAPAASDTARRHGAQGLIESLDRESVTLSHGPVPSAGMGAMTMAFRLPPRHKRPRGLAVGGASTSSSTSIRPRARR